MSAWGSVCPGGCLPIGVSAQRGVCLGVGGVCLGVADVCLGECLPRGGDVPREGVCPTLPVDRKTLVITLPFRNCCCGM